jgi:hypothetical protein
LLPFGARHKVVVLNDLQNQQARLDPDYPQYEHRGRHHQTALQHRAPVRIGLNHV